MSGTCGSDDVCTLPEEDFQDRVAVIRRDLLPLVTRREELPDGVAFEFASSAAVEATLRDFVAFERDCCRGLTWDIRRTSAGQLRLSIQGLPPGSEFFRAFDSATRG